MPARSFSTSGPANAFWTGTCWSIANPTSSANGSLAMSAQASGSSVKYRRSAMSPDRTRRRAVDFACRGVRNRRCSEATAPSRIFRETGRGRSERTPILALTGVGITIGAAVAFVVILGFLAYYLAA